MKVERTVEQYNTEDWVQNQLDALFWAVASFREKDGFIKVKHVEDGRYEVTADNFNILFGRMATYLSENPVPVAEEVAEPKSVRVDLAGGISVSISGLLSRIGARVGLL